MDSSCKGLHRGLPGYRDIVKALLAAGADKDKVDEDGVTPLIWAATQGHLKVVQVLLKAGAKVDKANKYGDSALIFATIRGHTEIVRLLQAAAAAAVAKKK